MTLRAAIYLRVSTTKQEAMNQHIQLAALCKARNWDIIKVYRDVAKGADPNKIAFNAMMHDARTGKFKVLVFWAWDRLTRGGVQATFHIMESLRSWGILWESHQEPFLSSASDPSTAELLLAIIAWMAKQERLRISERTKAGMAQRRALGFKFGPGYKKGAPPPTKGRRRRVRKGPLSAGAFR